MIRSIYETVALEKLPTYNSKSDIVQTIIDEILLEYTSLIADIEDQRVDASLLKKEISKKVDQRKGLYDAEGVKTQIFDAIYGYGILEPFIKDSRYTDIDAPRYDFITGKCNGKMEVLPIVFDNERVFERFCRLIIVRHGGVINAVDTHCRVSDRQNKMRINVCIAPRNASGTSLNIRKHREKAYSFDALVDLDFMTPEVVSILEAANKNRESLLICGKGASGKTTLLRTLIDSGAPDERVLICEADTEIYPEKKNTIVQQIQKQRAAVTLETLIREGLTMSLDTYCIGEITGSEAFPFVRAGHTDHRVLATLHASGAADALDRLLMLIENETDMSESALKKMIAHSVDKIIYLKNFKVEEILVVKPYRKTVEDFETTCVYKRAGAL